MKQGFKLLTGLLMMLMLAVSATAQINWLKQDGSTKYLAWDNGTLSKTIYYGNSATFSTGYFGSTAGSIVHLTATVNSKADGKIVSTIVSKDVNVGNSLGYEVITINPSHYNNKVGEYIIVIKLKDANSEQVDTSLYLNVKSLILEIPPEKIPFDFTPSMNPVPDKEVFENQNVQFTVSGSDLFGDTLTYESRVCFKLGSTCLWFNPSFVGATFNEETGQFSWTPNYEFVKHPSLSKAVDFRFRAIDDDDNKSTWELATITVKDVNRNPEFNPIGNKTIPEGQLLTFTFSATDADNDELTYSVLTGLPPGASFDSQAQQFKWTPTFSQAGVYSVTFKVIDNFGGKDIETITITVTDVTKPQCDDDKDNDGDGKKDENDPGCHTDGDPNDNDNTYDPTDDDETDPVDVPECKDGKDNDGDGKKDKKDPGCHTDGNPDNNSSYDPNDDDESDEDKPQCKDGKDNDGDGKKDFPNDPGCSNENDDDEKDEDKPECDDGIDNDGDGKIDYPADPGCKDKNDNSEKDPKPQCSDGKDNDKDGKIDYPQDPGCSSKEDNNESDDPLKPQCDDGKDNDGDGKVDYPADPGCKSKSDDLEKDSQCIDKIDNDEDGFIDYPKDPGCSSPDDNSETPVNKPQCNDGLDNDGDGKKDYPNDPGCLDKNDNNEINAEYQKETADAVNLTNIKFKSVFVEDELVYAGETMVVNANIFNNGETNLGDVEIQATIFEIGAFGSTSDFDLSKGKGASKTIYVPIPEDALPGWYMIKITAKNYHYHTSTYRIVYIDNNTF